jgi:hypothetical protein
MAERDFNITIGSDGGVELQATGLSGSSCLEAVRLFEKMVNDIKSHPPAAQSGNRDESAPSNPPKNIGSPAQTLL